MSALDALCADPHLVMLWARGWAVSRGKSAPTLAGGGIHIDVGEPEHKARYIFSRAGEHVCATAAKITEPWVFLKICAPPDAAERYLPRPWTVERVGFMMTCDSLTSIEPPLPPEFVLELSETDGIVSAAVRTGGEEVACGRLVPVEKVAIYDRIRTDERFRRRGLASAILAALGRATAKRGIVQGVLVATSDGRALYETLGWQMHSLYTTAAVVQV